jgi:hypothetical protein
VVWVLEILKKSEIYSIVIYPYYLIIVKIVLVVFNFYFLLSNKFYSYTYASKSSLYKWRFFNFEILF